MRTQFAESAALPEWAEGLPPDVVSTVRQEAMRRGIKPRALVREWTVETAKTLTAEEPSAPKGEGGAQ